MNCLDFTYLKQFIGIISNFNTIPNLLTESFMLLLVQGISQIHPNQLKN